MTKPDNPLPALMQTLGGLVDGDTLAELVAILAEPNGAAATRSLHRFLIAYSLASLLWGSLTSFCCGNNLV